MTNEIEKLGKSTYKIKVTVEAEKVSEVSDQVLNEAVKTAEVAGYRKGNAPKEKVKELLDPSKFRGQVLNELLKQFYPQVVKEHQLVVIANPKVEIQQFEEGKNLVFTATVAVKPDVKLGDYRKAIKDAQAKKIEEAKKKEPEKEPHIHVFPHEIIEAVAEVAEMEVPDMAIEEETDRLVARFIDQVQAAGMSMEKYLTSQNITSNQLREQYKTAAQKSLVAELALAEAIKVEGLEVTDEEILEMAKAAGDDKIDERMKNASEKSYLKSILTKNKLIQKLISEVEEPHDHKEHENE